MQQGADLMKFILAGVFFITCFLPAILYFKEALQKSADIALPAAAVEADMERHCATCHSNQKPVHNRYYTGKFSKIPPLFPIYYTAEWNIYDVQSEQKPPYQTIPNPHMVGRGVTYYDWTKKAIVEIYYNFCINLFPTGFNFPCKFINVDKDSFFITYHERKNHHNRLVEKGCCRFMPEGFYAPRPDAIHNMTFRQEASLDNKPVNWWVLDIPLPGPFFYAFDQKTNLPAAFAFPVIDGWVQQNFYNISLTQPDPNVFLIPKICKNAMACSKKMIP